MEKFKVLLVGHSHIQCIVEARDLGKLAPYGIDLEVINLGREKLVGHDPDLEARLRKIIDELALAGDGRSYDLVLAFMGGNTHNILGLIEMTPPFDFVLAKYPDLVPAENSVLVPESVIRSILQSRMQSVLSGLSVIKKIFGEAAVCVESSPPIGNDEYVRTHLDEFFRAEFEAGKNIVSAAMRFKLWRLASEIYEETCSRIGMVYRKCPASLLVDGMYLRPEGYPKNRNVTHGNSWYGEHLLLGLIPHLGELSHYD